MSDSAVITRIMRLGRLVLPLATIGLVVLMGTASSAQSPATTDEQIQGWLIGVTPTQRSLTAGYLSGGCGFSSVTPSVTETPVSVTVTLTAQSVVQPPGVACPANLLVESTTAALAAPLGGRAVYGLELQGGAFGVLRLAVAMPSLVGLSPYDARLMLTHPPGDLAGQPFGSAGPVGLVDHHTRHSRTGALAMVIAQRPLAGKPMRRHMIVVLTVAP